MIDHKGKTYMLHSDGNCFKCHFHQNPDKDFCHNKCKIDHTKNYWREISPWVRFFRSLLIKFE